MELSVIIATYNSANAIKALLEQLTKQEIAEVIVADAGSTDATIAVASQYGVNLVRAPGKNLGGLWDAGAKLTSNNVVWFLKPESVLPDNAGSFILDEMENNPYLGGYFSSASRWSAILVALKKICRFHFTKEKELNNGFFLRKSALAKINGLPNTNTPFIERKAQMLSFGKLTKINLKINIINPKFNL